MYVMLKKYINVCSTYDNVEHIRKYHFVKKKFKHVRKYHKMYQFSSKSLLFIYSLLVEQTFQ